MSIRPPTGGGGSAVTSVDGETGAVDLSATYLPQSWRAVKHKAADTTRTSTTTATADPDLTFDAGAAEVWVVTFALFVVSAGTAGDIKLTVAAPSGATGFWGYQSFLGVSDANVRAFSQALGSEVGMGVDTLDRLIEINSTITVGETAGAIALSWAQNTSSASGSTIKAHSHLYADRVA